MIFKFLNRCVPVVISVALALPVWGGIAVAADVTLPVIKGKKALATVNGEPITLEEYARQFAAVHEGATGTDQVRKMDPMEILERLIRIRLVVREAETMGLDGLPEVQKELETFRQDTLKSLLFRDRLRNVRKPDPKLVDKIYKESVKEIMLASVLLDKEDDAGALQSAIKEGGDFGSLVKAAVGEGKAQGSEKGSYVKAAELPPEMARVVSAMKPGEISPTIKAGKKFAIFKVDAIRFAEDKAKRAEAEKEALERKKSAELKKYVGSLEKKYVKYNEKVLAPLDFEAEAPGFEKLLQDERPVAWIKGENPVTVKDVAESLQKIFFHGIEQSIKQKRVNAKKAQSLDQIVTKRVVFKEAQRLKLDRSAPFKERLREFRKEILFGTFVQRVIDPENRVNDDELKRFLQDHVAEYTTPEKLRAEFLVFTNREDAEEAIAKLRAGADLQWLRANTPGQAEPSAAKDVLDFNGVLAVKSELPDGIEQALAGARKDDLRLHAGSKGLFHVIAVQEVIPPQPEDYESVRDRLAQRVFNEKRRKALDEWMDKLNKEAKVEIYARGKKLQTLLETQAW